jgi:hypothetical protein
VLAPEIDPAVLAEIRALEAAGDTENPRYEELHTSHYTQHVPRMAPQDWPDPVLRAFMEMMANRLPKGRLPVLPGRQPPGRVRRSADLLPRHDLLPAGAHVSQLAI